MKNQSDADRLAELAAFKPKQGDGWRTKREWMRETGHTKTWVTKCLDAGIEKGVIEIGRAERPRCDGISYISTVYRFVEGPR